MPVLDDDALDLEESAELQKQSEADAQRREEERRQIEVNSFSPPKITAGKMVNYYEFADTNSKPKICLVAEVCGRSLKLIGMAGSVRNELISHVPHASDPTLKYNEQIRRNAGCWDFTDADKETKKQFAAVYDELKSMASTLVKLQNAAGVPVTNHRAKINAELKQKRKLMQGLCAHHRLDIDFNKASDEQLENILNANNIPIKPLGA